MSPKKQRARKSPKKQKAKNQNKIEKFLVKSNVENKEVNSNNDEELQLKINDLKIKIRELLKEKRELECLTFPKPYKLKDIPLNYDGAKFADTSYGTHTAKFRLKFHEFVGCVVSKVDEKRLVIKFHVFEVNKVHVYGIKLNSEDNQEAEGVDYTFSKCFVPPMIKIKELLKKYPVLDDPKPLIRVLATACQVFHDIQIQIDQFKEKSDPKYVTIFNSLNNRVIELSFQMVQRSTESVFPVSVELPYDIYKPRPIQIFINSKEMPRSTLKEFKKHCKNFYRFSIWNAFEIITNMGLKQHESVFYLLQGQSELAELNTDKPTILIKKKAKVVEQILHDFTFDTDDEDASVQKNNLDSSLNKSNVEIGNKVVNPKKNESERSPESKRSRVKISFEQSFTNAETRYQENSSKIQVKDKTLERVYSCSTVFDSEKSQESKKSLHLKNISESERSPESKRSKVQRSLEQSFTNAETSYEENSLNPKIETKDKTSESVCSCSTVLDSEKSQESKKSLRVQTGVKRSLEKQFNDDCECRFF